MASHPSQQKNVSETPLSVTAQSVSREQAVSIGANRASSDSGWSVLSIDGEAIPRGAELGAIGGSVTCPLAAASAARARGSGSGGALHATIAPRPSDEAEKAKSLEGRP
jgi:hypothetical protein